jgi:hypothetical protein
MLEQAIRAANERIATQNDAARREDRDRMGTTLVLALVYGARLYIAHLGDSRAYRVRSHSCRQITLDDDVAAREMRLGLDLYPQALQAPGSGALVQALGMAPSQYLHPTIVMYPVATASLLLLCSDGLSDNALIDRLWLTELFPVLCGECPVSQAGQRLIDLANTHNGHDNVTVGLLQLVPTMPQPNPVVPAAWAQDLTASAPAPVSTQPWAAPAPTRLSSASPETGRRPWPWLLRSGLVAAIVAIAGIFAWQWWDRRPPATVPLEAPDQVGETLSPTAAPPRPEGGLRGGNLAVGDVLQIKQLPDPTAAATLIMTERPPAPEPSAAVDLPVRLLAIGSIVQVVSRQKTPDNQLWVRLRVCSVPTSTSEPTAVPDPTVTTEESLSSGEDAGDRAIPLSQPGEQGWLLETDLPLFADQVLDTSVIQPGLCTD